ncbi:PAS domain-containing protein [Pontibacter sp. E15-1]|uniref:PAS domain S-box protein n=1 Tax=Pontibacter sp. E15-1 TaxID=2919918 RepID=UPI001F4F4AAF|nr:PAS domain S-box protein [Pontibacter sp. E15-1]MCJ8164132.1 PAS domain-containing protein [Pontibacter sp. E15-1]
MTKVSKQNFPKRSNTPLDFLNGDRAAAARIDAFNWSATPLGNPEAWPQSLRTTLSIVRLARQPMLLLWGPDRICLYNDAYLLHLNPHLPDPLGKPAREVWPDKWHEVEAHVQQALQTGAASAKACPLLPLAETAQEKAGSWACSFSAVADESGLLASVLVTFSENNLTEVYSERLKESEHHWASLVHASSIPTCILLGKDHVVQVVNKAALRIWGDSRNAAGRSIAEAFPEFAQQHLLTILDEVYTTGIPYESVEDAVQLLHEGELTTVYMNFSFKPLRNTVGKIYALFCTGLEVTEMVMARRRLQDSEQTIRNVFSKAPVAIAIFKGADFVIEFANDKVLEYWDRSLDQVQGKPLFEALPEVSEQGFEELLTNVLTTGERYVAHERTADMVRNGVLGNTYINFVYEPYHELDGSISGILVVANEVTDQVISRKAIEESEQKLRSIFQQTPDTMALLQGPEFALEFVNEGMLRQWGKTREQVIGEKVFDVVPEVKGWGFEEILQQVYATGETYSDTGQPTPIERHGKLETIYLDFTYSPLRNTEGEVYGILATSKDVTNTILTKLRLEESEHRFRTMVQQAPVAIGLMRSRELVLEVANSLLLQLTGKAEDALGKSILEILPEVKGQPILDILYNVFDTGTPFVGTEVPVMLPVNDELRLGYYNTSYTPILEEGVVTGVLQVATDVTEQVLARKKLEENEEELIRFKFMADLARDPFILMREDGTFAYLNKRALDAWGYTAEEAKSIRVPDVDPIHNDTLFSQVFRKAQAETIPQYETLHQKKDGTIFPVEVNMGGLTIAGAPFMLAVARDITERKKLEGALKESEERFRIMADATPNIVWAVNPDGSLKYMNKYAVEFLGINLEQCLVDGWFLYLHPEDVAETSQLIAEAIEKSAPYSQEVRLLHKDGAYNWFLSKGAPSYFSDGTLYGYIGSAVDITELKEAKVALEVKNTQLVRINNDLDNFIYTASHDLKAPIANIEGFLQLLMTELFDPEVQMDDLKHILEMMQVSVERFKKTIASLTEVVKLQKAYNGETVAVNLQEIIEDVRSDLEPLILASEAQLNVSLENCESIQFSEKNLRSIVYNLLSNALKYRSPERHPVISIECTQNTEYHVLRVTDNGLGMNMQRSKQLFTMFTRFHDHVEGSGIGLYMVKKIVDNAGGTIKVDSQVGIGTTFEISFPVHPM